MKRKDIPLKILKQNADIFGSYICHVFNVCVDNNGTFSSVLKHPNITPVFKMGYRGSKVQFFHHQCLLIMRDYISFEHLLMNLEKQIFIKNCVEVGQ